jgi:YbgC/YbaW family acyl-CoA thioester hydrolase
MHLIKSKLKRFSGSPMFEYKLSVRGYELDSYGHVNNAVYLNYFEQARWEIFRQADLLNYFKDNHLLLVVTEMQIRYSREVKLFDELLIETQVEKEAPYLVFFHKMFLGGPKVKVCSANVKTILTDSDKLKYDIPDDFLVKLKSP